MSNKLKATGTEEDIGWDYFDQVGFEEYAGRQTRMMRDSDYEQTYKEKAYLRTLTPLQMVKEYQDTSGQEPRPSLYAKLIEEENSEWFNAPPGEEELKEMADLVYVIYGYANSLGYDLDEALRRVHKNNMDRMYQDDGTIHYRGDGKVEKNPNTPKVYLGDLV